MTRALAACAGAANVILTAGSRIASMASNGTLACWCGRTAAAPGLQCTPPRGIPDPGATCLRRGAATDVAPCSTLAARACTVLDIVPVTSVEPGTVTVIGGSVRPRSGCKVLDGEPGRQETLRLQPPAR